MRNFQGGVTYIFEIGTVSVGYLTMAVSVGEPLVYSGTCFIYPWKDDFIYRTSQAKMSSTRNDMLILK